MEQYASDNEVDFVTTPTIIAPLPTHNTPPLLPSEPSPEPTRTTSRSTDAGLQDPSRDTTADTDLSSFDLAPLHLPDFTDLPASYLALQLFPREVEEFAEYLLSDWERSARLATELDTLAVLAALEENPRTQRQPGNPTATDRAQGNTLPMPSMEIDTAGSPCLCQKRERGETPTLGGVLQHPTHWTPSIISSSALRSRKGKQRADTGGEPRRKRPRRTEPSFEGRSSRRTAGTSPPAQRIGARGDPLDCNHRRSAAISKIKRQATVGSASFGDPAELLPSDMTNVGPSCASCQSLRDRLTRISMPTLPNFDHETARGWDDTEQMGPGSATNDTNRPSRRKDKYSATEGLRVEASRPSFAVNETRPQDGTASYYTCPIEGCYVAFPSQRSRIIHLINRSTGHGWKRCPLCRTAMEPDAFRLHRCEYNAKSRIWSPCFRSSCAPLASQ